MNEPSTVGRPERLISLDVFRGITIAGMILVNHPGSWGHQFGPVSHAQWHGWTPTDLVFPFFLFIVGVAMAFSFDRRLAQGSSRVHLFGHVVRRTIILFLLGLIMYGSPNLRLIGPYILIIVGLWFLYADEPTLGWGRTSAAQTKKVIAWVLLVGGVAYFALDFAYFQKAHPPATSPLRVPGVLQRIAVCYFFASIIVMTCGVRGRVIWAALLIVGYWYIVKNVAPPADYVPGFAGRPEGLLHDWLDQKLLGAHLYRERPDPEGVLSSLPSIATVLLGVLTGNWLQGSREKKDKVIGLFLAANVALVVGLWMNCAFPINKKIWTSSYVVFTAGLAMHFLSVCFWLIDVKGYKRWAWPFLVYGTNPITVYFAAHLVSRLLFPYKIGGEESGVAFKSLVYDNVFASWAEPKLASLLFALTYVVIWCLLMIPMYRKRIFIKI
ncbi:MAG: DUF5009 domain-containing protein [Phycisphaerales bacterium]|nr:MAG: DUF5009 domain-containing protein [Phycisphaerales bacterium]